MPRLRDLGLTIGRFPTGPLNAITDVPGVWVGHTTLIHDEPRVARTGVTVILPREGEIWQDNAFAGFHTLNGCGEMTGVHWITESGMLSSPIALTNTGQVGTVHEALCAYGQEFGWTTSFALPVVAETYDGWLNDLDAFHLTRGHVYQAIAAARPGPVAEGNVGGGTGMICYDFKGGIGTASRRVEARSGEFVVGALVQANHGDRQDFRLNGTPVGAELGGDIAPLPRPEPKRGGSILIILATDAPLLPFQCRRLAQRSAVGFARTGGIGHNGSGDLFLAFATANHLPATAKQLCDLRMLPNPQMDNLFVAAAEAVEEAILNALTSAQTMTGFQGRTVHSLPIDWLREKARVANF
ncbi:MAG: P1 family peptidase [Caldilineales bacterium]|nr:P1 family peptidase [Caldilineales bacterium]MCW5859948.1 P1 family peptidase [Caldilineales bacterium]